MVNRYRRKYQMHQDISKKGENTMKYEEPEMKVIYLGEESVYTELNASTTGTGGTTDVGGWTDLYNEK